MGVSETRMRRQADPASMSGQGAWNSFRSLMRSWAAENDSMRCMRPWQFGQFRSADVVIEGTAENVLGEARSQHDRVRLRHQHAVPCSPCLTWFSPYRNPSGGREEVWKKGEPIDYAAPLSRQRRYP